MKIIEKEKDISEEFKARYDVQLISNSKLEKRVIEHNKANLYLTIIILLG